MNRDATYRIRATYKGKTETVDTAEDKAIARYLVGEYQLAYGREWHVFAVPDPDAGKE